MRNGKHQNEVPLKWPTWVRQEQVGEQAGGRLVYMEEEAHAVCLSQLERLKALANSDGEVPTMMSPLVSFGAQHRFCSVASLFLFLFSLFALSLPAHSSAVPVDDIRNDNGTVVARATEGVLAARAPPDFFYRILPLGASIMYGWKSSHGNG